jgi:hypothetical protein
MRLAEDKVDFGGLLDGGRSEFHTDKIRNFWLENQEIRSWARGQFSGKKLLP